MAAMARPLLQPLRMTTQHQKDQSTTALFTAGVPQGDGPSPTLFNIFLDPLLELVDQQVNEKDGTTSGYADDVIMLATNTAVLQQMLSIAEKWARENGMRWNCEKSMVMTASQVDLMLDGKTLRKINTVTYLGVTLDTAGVRPDATIARYDTVTQRSRKLSHALNRLGDLTKYHRRLLWQQMFQPAAAYGEHLVPLTSLLKHKQSNLDAAAASFILNTGPTRDLRQAMFVADIIPAEHRTRTQQEKRISHAVSARAKALRMENGTQKQRKVADTIRKVSTLRMHPPIHDHLNTLNITWPAPNNPEPLVQHLRRVKRARWQDLRTKVNRQSSRPIPARPPALQSSQPKWLQKRAIRYYLFRWPTSANRPTREHTTQLAALMRKDAWTSADENSARKLVRALRRTERRTSNL